MSSQSSWLSIFNIKTWGKYPEGYDPAVHGPYDPSRYYGKRDTPFGEVKIGEIPAWIARRDKGPRQSAALISRAFWRWQMKYLQPRKGNAAPIFQATVSLSILFYMINYLRIRGHRSYKYH